MKIAIKKRVINVGIFSNTRRNEYWFQNVTWEYYVGGKMVVRGKKPYTSERCQLNLIISFPRCKLLIRPLEILFMVNVLLFTAWRITQYVRLKNKSGCQLFLVIGLFIYVLARGHFSRPHLYPLSATNRIRSAIIELNRTRRKPSVLKVSLFSSLLIVSPSLSVKTNDNLRLD